MFGRFFDDSFMPHGHCYEWLPGILWTNAISDFLIALAYFSIPIAIFYIVKKRQDVQFKGVFYLFAAFILLCGITHLFSIFTIWTGSYGVQGILKALTAIVSLVTAVVLYKNVDVIISIPSHSQLEHAIQETTQTRYEKEKLEIEKKGDAIFRFTTELLPAGLLVIGGEQRILLANRAFARILGYTPEELIGKDLSILIGDNVSDHSKLVKHYIENPIQSHRMAAGRIVRGKHKDGSLVDLQISLSTHEFDNEKHVFATITDFGGFTFEQSEFLDLSNRLKRAIDASNDGIWEWNIQSDEVWYSPQLLKLIGLRKEEKVTFDDWKAHIHPDDLASVEQAIEDHLQHGKKFDLNYRGTGEHGEYQWFHTRGDTLKDNFGNPLLMSGTLSNINKTKTLQHKLEEKTHFLNQVLDRSLTGLYLFDLDEARNTYINPEYTSITGYTIDDLNKLQEQAGSLFPLFHPDDQANVQAHLNDVINNKEMSGVGIEYRFRHKDGSWCWLYSRDSIYSYDDDGKPKEMLGAFFDITELKNRENEIRRLALEYSNTFEKAGVGIAHVSMKGAFIKVNKKLADILEYHPDELESMSFVDITYPDDLARSRAALGKLISGEIDVYEDEKRYMCKSGKIIWANLTVSVVSESEHNAGHFISIIEDISSRKEIESRLSESNAALERFAYSASHDMQEPLRKISAFSGALERRLTGKLEDPEAKYQLKRICDASIRMGDMIDNLLQLSRISRSPLDITEVKLSTIVERAKEDLSSKIEKSGAKITLETDLTLWIDEKIFGQVLSNLIGNSIKYSRPDTPPVITISTYQDSQSYFIQVTDNGPGFDETEADKIFEPFRRLVGMDVPGTGMGLAICRQIVSAHGGKISARCAEPEGAQFTIELPIKNPKVG